MSKTIKTRPTAKSIKVLNKPAILSTRIKNATVKSKSAIDSVNQQADETQNIERISPTAYASDHAVDNTKSTAKHINNTLHKNPVKQAAANMDQAKHHMQEARRQVDNIKKAAKPAAQNTPQKEMMKCGQNARHTSDQARKMAKKTINTADKTGPKVAKTAKGTVKTVRKGVKTAEHGGKVAIKTAQQTAKGAQRAAKATVKTTKAAAQATRVAAKTAANAAKVTAKTLAAMVKAVIATTKALVAFLIATGWAAVAVILIICLIGLLFGSVFGIFFSGEDNVNGRTMPIVVNEVTGEFYEKIETIEQENPHDIAVIESMAINWRDVLAVYAVKVNTDQQNAMEVATLDDAKVNLLRSVLNDMVGLTYSISTETRERIIVNDDGEEETEEIEVIILTIRMEQKTVDDAAAEYGFTAAQVAQLHELLSPEYTDLWAALFGGYIMEDGRILVGNTGKVPIGIFSWPLEGNYPVNSPFGYRQDPFDSSKTVFHGGIDIACPAGTPILAAADGTVVVANSTDSWGGSYGYHVKIQHDGTYATLYAHCSQIAVTNGQQVVKGQVIAFVGSTGNSSGNHLHFEVYQNGALTDPLGYFGG